MSWWRSLATIVLLVGLYFVAPLGQGDDPLPLLLAVTLTAGMIVGMAFVILRRVWRFLDDPSINDLPTLILLWVVTVVVFSVVYFMLERSSPGEMADLNTRLDALYFTMATVATVGYGDVHAVGQTARAVACLHLAFNLVFVALLVRTASTQIGQRARERHGDPDPSGLADIPPSPALGEVRPGTTE